MAFKAGPYTITLGGSILIAGAATVGTITVPGARAGMVVTVTPQSDPLVGCIWTGFVSSNDTVTVRVIAIIGLTPNSVTYNVMVEN